MLGARFSLRLRQALLDSLLQQEIAFFDQHKTGEITSRLSADTQQVAQQVELNINVLLRSVVQAVVTLTFMALLRWELALTALLAVKTNKKTHIYTLKPCTSTRIILDFYVLFLEK